MKFNRRGQMFVAATALGVVLATPAVAQEAGGEDVGDIVVTARRVEERLQDVPISITVFSQSQIDNRNITTASDLAAFTPSLTSNNRFGSDKSSFTIRGFSQDGKSAPTVAVYFADVVAIRSNSGTGGSNGTGPGSFFDLQNVQVLKGPQGTLFGRNTTGGAILLVPQKPTDKLEGYVEGSIGNYDLKRVQAVVNIPLADTFKVRLGVDRQKRDGYLNNKSGIGPDRFADSNYVAVRASIVADLTPTLENYLIATYNRSDTNGQMFRISECNRTAAGGRPGVFAPLACAQVDRQRARGDGFYDVENVFSDPQSLVTQWQVINTTTWQASDSLTIKNVASYGEFREKTLGSIGGEYWVLPTGPLAGTAIGNTLTVPWANRYNNIQSAFTEELQLQGRAFENRLVWQAGAYLELSNPLGAGDTTNSLSAMACSDLYANRCTAALTGISGYGVLYNRIKNRNLGFYGQGTFTITDQLAITAGARYTMDKMSGRGGRLQQVFGQPNVITSTSCSNPRLTPTPGNLDPEQCDSGVQVNEAKKPTWVIDLEYKPISDVMLYAKYSRGYRQGGVDPSVIGLSSWNPERIDTYEVGAKTSFEGAVRGYFNFAAFYNNFQNQQIALAVAGRVGTGLSGARPILNAGKSKIWGIEADASVTVFDSLKFDLGYSYLNTELQAIVLPDFGATPYLPPVATPAPGIELPLSPKHRVTVAATYTLPLDPSIGRISVGANYVYTDTQWASIDRGPFTLLPSSHLVNANLNWNSVGGSPIDLAFFVTNLTKEKFVVNVTNNYGSNGYESFIPNTPRMYGVRLKYRFGS